MNNITAQSSPAELSAEAQAIIDDVQKSFGNLSAAQLNWQLNADQWSVGQCLEHLWLINEDYFPTFNQLVSGAKTTSFWERLPVLPNLFGKLLISVLAGKGKYKSIQKFAPAMSKLDNQILNRFIEQQQRLIKVIAATKSLPLAQTIITSVVSKHVTYSLQDAYVIILRHERRHLAQALRVIQTPGFPQKELP